MTERDVTLIAQILGEENVLRNEPMAAHTSFHVGGPADLFLRIGTEAQLIRALAVLRNAGEPCYLLGRGTNLLVGDGGYRGCMITLTGPDLTGIVKEEKTEDRGQEDWAEDTLNSTPQKACALFGRNRQGEGAGLPGGSGLTDSEGSSPERPTAAVVGRQKVRLRAGAGESLAALAAAARDYALEGLEFAAGIPGSVGGAVVMNAGAYGGSMDQVVTSARLLMQDDTVHRLDVRQLHFGYRHSLLKEVSAVVLDVTLDLAPGDPQQITQTMRELGRRRSEKQPLEYPSAGSTFKRPEGMFAGKLIMEAGLRGFAIGGAQVSEKHCGFVINRGGASAAEIRAVIDAVRQKVYETSGILLEEEVISIGEF